MPKRTKEMPARRVDSLKTDGRYAVGGVVGLYLVVRGVSRCWMLRIKVNGRRREFGLGSYPEVSLALARERAWERRRARFAVPPPAVNPPGLAASPEGGETPAPAVATQQPVDDEKTFEVCARTYVAAQAPGWKSAKHAKQWISTLETYAFPVVGTLNVAEIANQHILQILEPIWSTKTETATRLRGRIENILGWATHRGGTEAARTPPTGRPI